MFEVTYTKPDWHTTEIPLFILLGITMGIYGAVFCKLNILWSKKVRQLELIKRYLSHALPPRSSFACHIFLPLFVGLIPFPPAPFPLPLTGCPASGDALTVRFPTLEVVLVVLTTATIAYYNRYTKISGTRLVEDLLSECHSKDGVKGEWDGLCARRQNDIPRLLGLLGLAIIIKALLYASASCCICKLTG
jgi:chloride channel 3/4/5